MTFRAGGGSLSWVETSKRFERKNVILFGYQQTTFADNVDEVSSY